MISRTAQDSQSPVVWKDVKQPCETVDRRVLGSLKEGHPTTQGGREGHT